MNWFQFILTYAVCWWLVLFMVLPFGVTTPVKPGLGHAPSAPENPRLKRKMLITTLITFIPSLLIMTIANAHAAEGIYHAGSSHGCIDYKPSADLNATDSNATLNPNPMAKMDDMPVALDIPVQPYLDQSQPNTSSQPHSAYNVDVRDSDVMMGVIDVKRNGESTLNGQPINSQGGCN